MKTKEEILSDCFGELGDPERELTSKPYSAIISAMDIYTDGLLHDQANKFQKQLTDVEMGWFNKIPKWIKTTDGLPEKDASKTYSYSHSWCLVVKNGVVYIAAFNHEDQCWDDEEADDYWCDIDQVEYWMPLPEPPKK